MSLAQNWVLAETPNPPFIAVIFYDTTGVDNFTVPKRRPTDEMVSLAPAQMGFMGLETTRDESGLWLSVVYWSDMAAYTEWYRICVKQIKSTFPNNPIDSLFKIKVASVKEPISHKRRKHLIAERPTQIQTNRLPLKRRLTNVIPSIVGFFDNASFR
ncbi:MAG: hypothetical protein CBB68_04665 [Rhodospirillaceae bacterium TMED8]|nr:hypothetical protein [Magnetovibrio sp.]OUT51625.1 MAG: hypothetical protein CBB68_04665 [Rhodospirillaceae bacterium TMED8]